MKLGAEWRSVKPFARGCVTGLIMTPRRGYSVSAVDLAADRCAERLEADRLTRRRGIARSRKKKFAWHVRDIRQNSPIHSREEARSSRGRILDRDIIGGREEGRGEGFG